MFYIAPSSPRLRLAHFAVVFQSNCLSKQLKMRLESVNVFCAALKDDGRLTHAVAEHGEQLSAVSQGIHIYHFN